jgi:Na+/H+ antiporter NhaC
MNQARLFLIIIALLISFFLTYYSQTYLITEDHIYSLYSTQLSYEQIEKMLANQEKWAWVGYAVLPVFYFIKIGLVSTCVYVGVLLGASQKVGFKKNHARRN